jgi:hypothetical protein
VIYRKKKGKKLKSKKSEASKVIKEKWFLSSDKEILLTELRQFEYLNEVVDKKLSKIRLRKPIPLLRVMSRTQLNTVKRKRETLTFQITLILVQRAKVENLRKRRRKQNQV